MEVFEKERATFLHLFWAPIAVLVLGIPCGLGRYELLLGCYWVSLLLSCGFLLWGSILIAVGVRLRLGVRSLLLATAVTGLPLLYTAVQLVL